MKSAHIATLAILLACMQLHGKEIFREVNVTPNYWEITFHEQGVRYIIEIDSVQRGVSGYLQTLKLKPTEKLRLTGKHSNLEIKPIKREGMMGVEIIVKYKNPRSGKLEQKAIFEKNHRPDKKLPAKK